MSIPTSKILVANRIIRNVPSASETRLTAISHAGTNRVPSDTSGVAPIRRSITPGTNGGKKPAIRTQNASGFWTISAVNIIGRYGITPANPTAPPEWMSLIAAPTVPKIDAMNRYPRMK